MQINLGMKLIAGDKHRREDIAQDLSMRVNIIIEASFQLNIAHVTANQMRFYALKRGSKIYIRVFFIAHTTSYIQIPLDHDVAISRLKY